MGVAEQALLHFIYKIICTGNKNEFKIHLKYTSWELLPLSRTTLTILSILDHYMWKCNEYNPSMVLWNINKMKSLDNGTTLKLTWNRTIA